MTSTPENDPYPASEFDEWAAQYDADVAQDGFPFTGYQAVLAETVRLAAAGAGMAVLDLGAGTGNLSERFLALGCELWCTDFSSEMIEKARAKLPAARFFLHDLRQPLPADLQRRFDRIVSAYVFHHFELPEKVTIVEHLVHAALATGGRLVIADISFPTRQALDAVRRSAGDQWDEEDYWIAEETLPALAARQVAARYVQVSNCAGIYVVDRHD